MFTIAVRIYYEDTDAGGIVYYASYLRFMERARTEWLRRMGFEINELTESQGVLLAVRSVQVEYLKPAKLNDLLEVGVELEHCGRASVHLIQDMRRDHERICRARVRLACLGADSLAPSRLPPPLRTELTAWKMP